MSSCKGAPGPHLDCTHGDACDWRDPEVIDLPGALLFETEHHRPPANRAERRRAERMTKGRGR